MSVVKLVEDNFADDLQTTVHVGGVRYLVSTRCSGDHWIICTTNGVDLFKAEISNDMFKDIKKAADIRDNKEFFNKLRHAFESGDVAGGREGQAVTLSLSTITLELTDAKTADKRVETQLLLFNLFDKTQTLTQDLTKCKADLKAAKDKFSGLHGKAAEAKKEERAKGPKAGMSVLNPGSRKRKAPKGVQFD